MCKNRFYFFSLTIALLLASSSIARANPFIKVTISADQESFSASEKVLIHVVTINLSKNSEKILKWVTAFDEVEESLFSISRSGVPVKYTGMALQASSNNEH